MTRGLKRGWINNDTATYGPSGLVLLKLASTLDQVLPALGINSPIISRIFYL